MFHRCSVYKLEMNLGLPCNSFGLLLVWSTKEGPFMTQAQIRNPSMH
jgi:hypothetical protein